MSFTHADFWFRMMTEPMLRGLSREVRERMVQKLWDTGVVGTEYGLDPVYKLSRRPLCKYTARFVQDLYQHVDGSIVGVTTKDLYPNESPDDPKANRYGMGYSCALKLVDLKEVPHERDKVYCLTQEGIWFAEGGIWHSEFVYLNYDGSLIPIAFSEAMTTLQSALGKHWSPKDFAGKSGEGFVLV